MYSSESLKHLAFEDDWSLPLTLENSNVESVRIIPEKAFL
jgi:hypothetical protein